MNKVLIFSGGPRDKVFDISTAYSRNHAFVEVFKMIDARGLCGDTSSPVVSSIIGMARAGNPEACENIVMWLNRKRLSTIVEEVFVEDVPPERHVDDFVITEEMVEGALAARNGSD